LEGGESEPAALRRQLFTSTQPKLLGAILLSLLSLAACIAPTELSQGVVDFDLDKFLAAHGPSPSQIIDTIWVLFPTRRGRKLRRTELEGDEEADGELVSRRRVVALPDSTAPPEESIRKAPVHAEPQIEGPEQPRVCSMYRPIYAVTADALPLQA
jgi:hypothetical protein